MKPGKRTVWVFGLAMMVLPVLGQQDPPPAQNTEPAPAAETQPSQAVPPPTDPNAPAPETKEEETITGGVAYKPTRTPGEKLRDPFKSPFEIEQEKEDDGPTQTLRNLENVEPYDVGELDLRGIYLDSRSGYWAIFKIGDEHDWFQIGSRFRDGDLINITDNAVIFKHYASDDGSQVREIVKELHRGEE